MAFFGIQHFGYSDYRKGARIFWSAALAGTLLILGLSIAGAVQFPLSKVVVLFSAMCIAGLTGQYELRLPKTHIELNIGVVVAIWGVFWLGVSGGVLLGVAAFASRISRDRNVRAPGVFAIFTSVIAIGLSAAVFSLIYQVTSDQDLQWVGIDDTNFIIIGSTVIMLANFVIFTLIDIGFRVSQGTSIERYGKTINTRIIQVIPSLGSTIVLCLLFAHFGIAFGLVVAPLAVMGVIAYRIHLNSLELKTAQILEASRIHLATVEAIATAIDARDQIGTGHVRRTQIYAVGLGNALSLSENEIDALRTGALLHDIGKLAVPDHILSKPGQLTPAELEKTKIHSAVGASILENVGFQSPVVPTVKYHHEFWNGAGYPEGLSGERIPLTARILAIADTFDTLRNARPYRSAMSREKAREHMLERSGLNFDPKLLNVFLKNLASFEAEIEVQGLAYDPVESNIHSLLDDPAGGYVEQIKLANKEVVTLFELAREFSSCESLPAMLSLFSAKIKELVPFDTCAVYLLDDSKINAHAVHIEGDNRDVLLGKRIKAGEGATGFAMKKLESVRNVNPDLDFSVSHLELIQQYSTMAAVPLFAEDTLIGAVSVYANELESYDEEHIRLLDAIAKIAAEAISKSKQHAEAKAHALTDPMTGLPNARSLQLQFNKEVGRTARSGISFQVLVLDLDGFKAVNDTFGHKVGDEMLRGVSRVISEQLREYDFLARYGGDEFVALIPEADQEVVVDVCSRIEKAVSEFRLTIDEHRYASVGVSIGAAGYPAQGQTFDQMVIAADKAMYVRKARRKQTQNLARQTATAPLSELLAQAAEYDLSALELPDRPTGDGLIVELDESAVLASASVN